MNDGDRGSLSGSFFITTPAADARTCQVTLTVALTPRMEMFETVAAAAEWPLIQSLLRIDGVHSVIAKNKVLIVARKEGADWTAILPAMRRVLSEAAVGAPAPGAVEAASGAADEALSRRIRDQVQELLDEEINPSVAAHGGVISVTDVQGTRVYLHMGGGCQGCGMAAATLRQGVETTIRSRVPEVTEILDSTDHGAGLNPYF